jgi:hypothetical protein
LKRKNLEIRRAVKEARLRLWQVAKACGITDSGFSRMLREELPPEKYALVMSIVERLQEREP